jgi:hypothetical protein
VPPRGLAPPLHRLPPILDNAPQTPTSSCSKGSRGLSVQPRVLGIFTETTVSPGPSLRQCPSRYAIRAGRNFTLIPCFQGRRLSLHRVEVPASHRSRRFAEAEPRCHVPRNDQSLRGQARRADFPRGHLLAATTSLGAAYEEGFPVMSRYGQSLTRQGISL